MMPLALTEQRIREIVREELIKDRRLRDLHPPRPIYYAAPLPMRPLPDFPPHQSDRGV